MLITKCSRKVSKRDFDAIKRMHSKRQSMTQTKSRRIKIWPAIGDPEALDVHITTRRLFPNKSERVWSNLIKIDLTQPEVGAV